MKENKMDPDYKVGDLIYDANMYDGLNTFLSDLPLESDKNIPGYV